MSEIAVKYDLTQRMMPFLDRHLIYPLVNFLGKQGLYDEKLITQTKYELLKDTNMHEYTQQLWSELNGGNSDVPAPESKASKPSDKELEQWEQSSKKVMSIFADEEVRNNLKQDKLANLQYLESTHNITSENIVELYKFGQYQYSCGNYQAAADYLYHVRVLSTDSQLVMSATWGKCACDILTMQWDAALEELQKLRDTVDQRSFGDSLAQLHQRTWVIHWSLFPLFNSENGREALCDLFFTSSYISTIQAACPWILRYLTAAVVTLYKGGVQSTHSNSSSAAAMQKKLKDLVRVVTQELYEYEDPVTQFISALYVDYDFEEAQNKLSEAEVVLKNDFFLESIAPQFLDCARHLISELYCRIHQRIDISQLSERLNLSPEQGEKWIATLIRGTRMDAKIDESEGAVIMNHPVPSVYQQVIEKTKGLTFRSNQVLSQVSSKNEQVA